MTLEVGKIYRLRFPGIAARVLPTPTGIKYTMDGEQCVLVESVFRKSRWWVAPNGKPNNHKSPWLVPR